MYGASVIGLFVVNQGNDQIDSTISWCFLSWRCFQCHFELHACVSLCAYSTYRRFHPMERQVTVQQLELLLCVSKSGCAYSLQLIQLCCQVITDICQVFRPKGVGSHLVQVVDHLRDLLILGSYCISQLHPPKPMVLCNVSLSQISLHHYLVSFMDGSVFVLLFPWSWEQALHDSLDNIYRPFILLAFACSDVSFLAAKLSVWQFQESYLWVFLQPGALLLAN